MPLLSGVFGRIGFGKTKYSGTDDRLFLGVHGPGGGREWNIATMSEEYYEANSNYWFTIGDSGFGTPIEYPEIVAKIELEKVISVYLRKSAPSDSAQADNALRIEWADIDLEWNGPNPARKTFDLKITEPIILSVTRGLQVWLRDGSIGGIGSIPPPF